MEPHKIAIQARFNDFDMFGHVNNTAYMQYFDLGKSMYFNSLLNNSFDVRDLSAAIVNINCNFMSSTVPGEPLEVHTACVRLGDRSFTLHQRVLNPVSGSIKCDNTTVLAGIDLRTLQSAPLNARLRQALEEALLPEFQASGK